MNIYTEFKRSVLQCKNRIALADCERKISYAGLHRLSLAYAQHLSSAGARPGDRCTISLPNSIDAAAIIIATWRIGAIPVLLNHQSPNDHLEHAIQKTASSVAIIDNHHQADDIRSTGVILTRSELLLAGQSNKVTSEQIVTIANESTIPCEQIASVIFTSGSTGLPKGVMQCHNTLINCCRNIITTLRLTKQDTLLCPVPWTFDYGFGQLLITLLGGISQALPSSGNPFEVCSGIEQHKPSVLVGVPSLFANLVFGVSPIKTTNLSSIRLITSTGSAMHEKVQSSLVSAFPNAKLSLNYGLTESYRSTCLPVSMAPYHPTSVGYPLPGVHILILREDGTIARENEPGEIIHYGSGVFMGYWGNLNATRKNRRFLPTSLTGLPSDQPTLFTGDIGYKDARGLLYIQGRKDRQIKSMGVRVGLEEIESRLMRHPVIKEAAVITRHHEILGDQIIALLTFIGKAENNHKQLIRAVRLYCKETMSPFMIPGKFICLPFLPRTHSGKIDYQQLSAIHTPITQTARSLSA